jgi:energy-coupling factor transporter ATP-binding protein EcfA2
LRTQALDRGIAILVQSRSRGTTRARNQKDSEFVRASICPYRGLLHFREEDAPFFCGREAAVENLTSAVQCHSFVAVVGASGSGKSSVVRAGLVPRLRSERRTAWETVILVPTDRPLKALATAFVPLLEPTMGEVDRLAEAAKLAEHLRSGTISLDAIVERILAKQYGTDRVLIVVDQFEELYTLTPKKPRTSRERALVPRRVLKSRTGVGTNRRKRISQRQGSWPMMRPAFHAPLLIFRALPSETQERSQFGTPTRNIGKYSVNGILSVSCTGPRTQPIQTTFEPPHSKKTLKRQKRTPPPAQPGGGQAHPARIGFVLGYPFRVRTPFSARKTFVLSLY